MFKSLLLMGLMVCVFACSKTTMNDCEITCNASCTRAKQCSGGSADCPMVCKGVCKGQAGPKLSKNQMGICLAHIKSMSCDDMTRLAQQDASVLGDACGPMP